VETSAQNACWRSKRVSRKQLNRHGCRKRLRSIASGRQFHDFSANMYFWRFVQSPLQGLIIRTATLSFLIRSRKGVRIEICFTNLHSTWIAKCRRRITNWHSNVYGNESANMEDARAKYTGSWHASLSAWSRLNAGCSRNALSEVCGRVSKHKH
jgi:hypothetical protein